MLSCAVPNEVHSLSGAADKESAYFSVADVMSEFCGMRSQTTDSTSRSETAGLLPFQPPGDPEMALGDGDAAGGEASDDIIQVRCWNLSTTSFVIWTHEVLLHPCQRACRS